MKLFTCVLYNLNSSISVRISAIIVIINTAHLLLSFFPARKFDRLRLRSGENFEEFFRKVHCDALKKSWYVKKKGRQLAHESAKTEYEIFALF